MLWLCLEVFEARSTVKFEAMERIVCTYIAELTAKAQRAATVLYWTEGVGIVFRNSANRTGIELHRDEDRL